MAQAAPVETEAMVPAAPAEAEAWVGLASEGVGAMVETGVKVHLWEMEAQRAQKQQVSPGRAEPEGLVVKEIQATLTAYQALMAEPEDQPMDPMALKAMLVPDVKQIRLARGKVMCCVAYGVAE